jgi:hypothetical protein
VERRGEAGEAAPGCGRPAAGAARGKGRRPKVGCDPDMRAPLAAGERGEKRGRGFGPHGPEVERGFGPHGEKEEVDRGSGPRVEERKRKKRGEWAGPRDEVR